MDRQEDSGKLLGPVQIRALAEELGVSPTKKLGQNFVHDAGTVRKIVRRAGVGEGDEVLEVGPGLGSLTLGLLEAGTNVTALELDGALARALPDTVRGLAPEWVGRLRVTNKDALDLSPEDFQVPPVALVANLPYNVAVPILLTALERLPSLRSAFVMVQKEVADRLVAEKGSKTYGAPTVKLAWYGAAKRAGIIGPNVFWPKPNVDSALVDVQVREEPPGDEVLRTSTFALIDAAFEQRRKMVRASLRTIVADADALSAGLEEAGVDPQARPEALEIQDFIALAQALGKAGDAGVSGVSGDRVRLGASDPVDVRGGSGASEGAGFSKVSKGSA